MTDNPRDSVRILDSCPATAVRQQLPGLGVLSFPLRSLTDSRANLRKFAFLALLFSSSSALSDEVTDHTLLAGMECSLSEPWPSI